MQKFTIPQEVQREDRIFGPITMRRLIILCIGGGITYVLYLWLRIHGTWVWIPPVLMLASITAALAFLELFGMKFEKFFIRFLQFVLLPRQQIWDKRYSMIVFFEYIAYRGSQKITSPQKKSDLDEIIKAKQEKLESVSMFQDHPLHS